MRRSRFASIAQKEGWAVAEASKTGNIEDHYDFHISKDSRQFRVDVKSRKRVARKAGGVQEDLVWIEFRTVRDTKGWLFGSADLIAFENQARIQDRRAQGSGARHQQTRQDPRQSGQARGRAVQGLHTQGTPRRDHADQSQRPGFDLVG
ncbi:MAG: hypothetical protein MZV64_60050 [Ignavibacteriales bacterium]|nr:hypothetical protein [Ignavibacteriales bacterium]